MRFILVPLLIFPLIAGAQDRYEATFSEGLETVTVSVCYERSSPRRLSHSAGASAFTEFFRFGESELTLGEVTQSIRLPEVGDESCAKWRINLAAATAQKDSRTAIRLGDDLVMDTALWFWRGSTRNGINLQVHLPQGMDISLPWAPQDRQGNTVIFEFPPGSASLASRTAVGRFDSSAVTLGRVDARLVIPGSPEDAVRTKLTRWISGAVNSVAGVYGRFPQRAPQILVIPIGSRSEAVPWAHVMRGGDPSAEFFVDETRSLEELAGDWTATHEFSHMLLPRISSSDRWFSEGLASYYQYVLMARAGTLDEQQAWKGLLDGFARGKADNGGGTLADATGAGWEYTMRVYWSGAAMMLLADTRLRAATGGRQSLDTALDGLQRCCMKNQKSWPGELAFNELDRLTGRNIFGSLFREYVFSSRFPDVDEILGALGVDYGSGEVTISDEAPMAEIRTAIMGAR